MARLHEIYTNDYQFVTPAMPRADEEVKFSILTARGDFKKVYLVIDEDYESGQFRDKLEMYIDEEQRRLRLSANRYNDQDVYSIKKTIKVTSYYHYELITHDNQTVFYNRGYDSNSPDSSYYNYDYRNNFEIVPNKPRLNAIYSDEHQFITPFMPKTGEKVKFSILTAKGDFKKVTLVLDEKLATGTVSREVVMHPDEEQKASRISKGKSKIQDIYSAETVINVHTYYHYELITLENKKVYYNLLHLGPVEEGCYYVYNYEYNFQIIPDWIIPDWAQKCINYQEFVDRFCNGNPNSGVIDNEWMSVDYNKVTVAKDWNDFPNYQLDVYNFHNGNLEGIIAKRDYLVSLGVGCVYLNPIFVSPSNHRYDIQDYNHVDPHIAGRTAGPSGVLKENSSSNLESERYISVILNEENLEEADKVLIYLINYFHEANIKVILDGVFNHCSSYHKWLDRGNIYSSQTDDPREKGAFMSKESKYRDYFFFENPEIDKYNTTYEGWRGFDTLPKLYYENSEELVEEIMRVACKWVSAPFNADGWRLDVAGELGRSLEFRHQFWKKFRKRVKEANPNSIIVAEHYEDASSYLKGDEWDSIMGYTSFMDPIGWWFTGIDKHCDSDKNMDEYGNSAALHYRIRKEFARLPIQARLIAFNQLSNHDHARFLTRTKGERGRIETRGSSSANLGTNAGIYKEATIMMYIWPGMPTIYYGDEAGVAGWTDPDNRRTYPWGREDKELIEFHRELGKLYQMYEAFRSGSILPLLCEKNTLAMAKLSSNEDLIVIFNNENTVHTRDIKVDVSSLLLEPGRTLKIIFRSNVASFKISEKLVTVDEDETITVKLTGFASAIIVA